MHNFWKCQSQFEILPKQIHEMRSNLSSFDPFLELSQTISQCTRKKREKKNKNNQNNDKNYTYPVMPATVALSEAISSFCSELSCQQQSTLK